jgi:hypothetical protein
VVVEGTFMGGVLPIRANRRGGAPRSAVCSQHKLALVAGEENGGVPRQAARKLRKRDLFPELEWHGSRCIPAGMWLTTHPLARLAPMPKRRDTRQHAFRERECSA